MASAHLIKGGCQSGIKVVAHNSKSDLPLVVYNMLHYTFELRDFSNHVEDAWHKLLHFAPKMTGCFFHSEDPLTPLLARVLLDGRPRSCIITQLEFSRIFQQFILFNSFLKKKHFLLKIHVF